MGDHADPDVKGRRHIEYDAATNRYYLRDVGHGTHLYQNLVVNPHTGDQFLYVSGPADRTRPGWYEGGIFKYDAALGQFTIFAVAPMPITNYLTAALSWWDGPIAGGSEEGALAWYFGSTGVIYLLNPLTKAWTAHSGMTPGRVGIYHQVSAFSKKHQRLVYGGGNGGSAPTRLIDIVDRNGKTVQISVPDNRKLWAMESAGNTIAMPDAPFHIGMWHGGNLVADEPTGNVHLIGFGQHHTLNPVTATWTRLADPPADLLTPIGQGKPGGFVSCSTPWGIVCIDGDRARTPKCRMRLYRA